MFRNVKTFTINSPEIKLGALNSWNPLEGGGGAFSLKNINLKCGKQTLEHHQRMLDK